MPRKRVRLLVVDEEPAFCEVLREVVELAGHVYDITLEVTGSGQKAAELLNSWEPSVILIDAFLSDMNSLDLLKRCAQSPAPVIFASSEASSEIEEAARTHGASGYVCKSDNVDEVECLLHQLAGIATDNPYSH